MADFLLLRRPISLLFAGWTRSSSLHYVFALLFSPLFRVNLFNLRGQGWLGSMRRPWRKRWKPRLGRLPRLSSSWLVLYQLQQAFLGFLWIPISFGRFLGDKGWLNTSNSFADAVRSTKPFLFCFSSSSSPSLRMGEGDGTPAERVAIENGWENGVLVGSEMPSRTTNPS